MSFCIRSIKSISKKKNYSKLEKYKKFRRQVVWSAVPLCCSELTLGHLDYDWGIISIKFQDCDYEIPMDPITAMRNALGAEEGGSGVPLNRAEYMKSVEFWINHVVLS